MAETILTVFAKGVFEAEDMILLNTLGRYHFHLNYVRPYQKEFSGFGIPGYLMTFKYGGEAAEDDPIVTAFESYYEYDRETFETVVATLADPGDAPAGSGLSIGGGTPSKPSVPIPSSLATTGSAVTVADTSTSYFFHVQISQDAAFTSPADHYGTATGTTHSIDVTVTDRYFVRARFTTEASGGGTAGGWTDSIVYIAKPPTASVITHSGNSMSVENTTGSYYFHIEISSSDEFTNSAHYYSVASGTQHSLTVTVPNPSYARGRFTTSPNGDGVVGDWGPVYNYNVPSKPTSLAFTTTNPFVAAIMPQDQYTHIQWQQDDNLEFSSPNTTYTSNASSISVDISDGNYLRARFTTEVNGGGTTGPWSDTLEYIFPPEKAVLSEIDLGRYYLRTPLTPYYTQVQFDENNQFNTPANYYSSGLSDPQPDVAIDVRSGFYRSRFTTEQNGQGVQGPWSDVYEVVIPPAPVNVRYDGTNLLADDTTESYQIHYEVDDNREFSSSQSYRKSSVETDHSVLTPNLASGVYIRAFFSTNTSGSITGPFSDTIYYIAKPPVPSNVAIEDTEITADTSDESYYFHIQNGTTEEFNIPANYYDDILNTEHSIPLSIPFQIGSKVRARFTSEESGAGVRGDWSDILTVLKLILPTLTLPETIDVNEDTSSSSFRRFTATIKGMSEGGVYDGINFQWISSFPNSIAATRVGDDGNPEMDLNFTGTTASGRTYNITITLEATVIGSGINSPVGAPETIQVSQTYTIVSS